MREILAGCNDVFCFFSIGDVGLTAPLQLGHGKKLGGVDHVIVKSSAHEGATYLNQEAERAFGLPHNGADIVTLGQGRLSRALGCQGVGGRRDVSRANKMSM